MQVDFDFDCSILLREETLIIFILLCIVSVFISCSCRVSANVSLIGVIPFTALIIVGLIIGIIVIIIVAIVLLLRHIRLRLVQLTWLLQSLHFLLLRCEC